MDAVEADFLKKKATDHLLHLNIARRFIEEVTGVVLPVDVLELHERFRNGVYLALLVRCLTKCGVPIYDEDQSIYDTQGLQFKHVSNIEAFFGYLNSVSLPTIFHPELLDIYAKKNISKLLYCLRALMHHIDYKLENEETFEFTTETINKITHDVIDGGEFCEKFDKALCSADYTIFCKLVQELLGDTLKNEINNLKEICLLYFEELTTVRSRNRRALSIGQIINIIKSQFFVYKVTVATASKDKDQLLDALWNLQLSENVCRDYLDTYMSYLSLALDIKKKGNFFNYLLTYADIMDAIDEANSSVGDNTREVFYA